MYQFNLVSPPRLREIPDVLSIPKKDLSKTIGQAAWSESSEVRTSPNVLNWIVTTSNFTAVRVNRWVMVETPIHYAGKVSLKITETRGYKRTAKESIEKALNITVSGNVPLTNLKAEVKADLKLTNESTEEWREEQVKSVDFVYEKDTTYVGWNLLDSVIVHKVNVQKSLLGPNRIVTGESHIESDTAFDVVLRYYQDALPDAGGAAFASLVTGLGKATV